MPDAPTRTRDLTELTLGYALILLVLWTPRPWQRLVYWAPVLYLLYTGWRSFPGWNAMGFRTVNLLRSSWILAVALALAGTTAFVAHRQGTLHAPPTLTLFFLSYIGYTVWSFVQQLLLLAFFLARLLRLLPKPWQAALAAAGIFALAHLPNPVLTPLTLLWGAASCLLFLRYRNIVPLALTHAIFGITVAVALPVNLTHSMRVGLGYWRFHPRHHRSHTDQIVSTAACVIAEAPTRRS